MSFELHCSIARGKSLADPGVKYHVFPIVKKAYNESGAFIGHTVSGYYVSEWYDPHALVSYCYGQEG